MRGLRSHIARLASIATVATVGLWGATPAWGAPTPPPRVFTASLSISNGMAFFSGTGTPGSRIQAGCNRWGFLFATTVDANGNWQWGTWINSTPNAGIDVSLIDPVSCPTVTVMQFKYVPFYEYDRTFSIVLTMPDPRVPFTAKLDRYADGLAYFNGTVSMTKGVKAMCGDVTVFTTGGTQDGTWEFAAPMTWITPALCPTMKVYETVAGTYDITDTDPLVFPDLVAPQVATPQVATPQAAAPQAAAPQAAAPQATNLTGSATCMGGLATLTGTATAGHLIQIRDATWNIKASAFADAGGNWSASQVDGLCAAAGPGNNVVILEEATGGKRVNLLAIAAT